ncbi:hypothetical protein PAXRUDRAFT_179902, partial [Paxillus rubicundulus Ve08.2h10]
IPHQSWFQTYSLLVPPLLRCGVPLGCLELLEAEQTSASTYVLCPCLSSEQGTEIILTNVLLILELQVSLISMDHLSTTRLSTVFPASSSTCYVQKGRTPALTGTH